MGYTFLEDPDNVKFRADGVSLEEMFVFAAEALNETIRGDIEIAGEEERSFEIEGEDNVGLLHDFLDWFLVTLDSEDFLVSEVKSIEIKDGFLRCVAVGDKGENYSFTNDVRDITFNEMYVCKGQVAGGGLQSEGSGEALVGSGRWECQVVLEV